MQITKMHSGIFITAVFVLSVAGLYYECWYELRFVPIKISQLGRGQCWEYESIMFIGVGMLLACHCQFTKSDDDGWLLTGIAMFVLIGLVNGHAPAVRIAHLLITNMSIGCMLVSMWKKGHHRACRLVLTLALLEAACALINAHILPNDPITFRASALFQYAGVAVLARFVLFD